MTLTDVENEFDRQAKSLIDLGYPAMAGLGAAEFFDLVSPLRVLAEQHAHGDDDPAAGKVPFLLVVTRQLAPIEHTMQLTAVHGKNEAGFVDRTFEPGALERFVETPGVDLPNRPAHLAFDVERGEEFCGVSPNDAMDTIAKRRRSPLTIEEGIALIALFPQLLVKNKCFSLGASRSGDRRVPALWISKNAPKLGWCWEGNPHTWLGVASAGARAAV